MTRAARSVVPHARLSLGAREAAAASRSLRSGALGSGGERALFEKKSARFLGVRGAVAVNTGVTAFSLALRALGAGPGKEVVVPAYARPEILSAVLASGATPVAADALWHDMNISVTQVRRRLTHRTAVIVAVHTFGASVELEPLLKLGVPVLEDVSEAFGARDYNRRMLGSFGAASAASFRVEGLMTSGGEGGMVLSNDRRVLDAVRLRRTPDAEMTDLQSSVGAVQLARLPSFLAERRRLADRYRAALTGEAVELPLQIYGRVYHRFIIKLRFPISESFLSGCLRGGVDCRRPISRPLYWDMKPAPSFPVADRLWRRSLSLPFYPGLTETALNGVVSRLRVFLLSRPHSERSLLQTS